MDPITLAILAGTAGTAAGQLPQLIKSDFEKQNEARLAELRRREREGLLGLTGRQEAVMERGLTGRGQAVAMGAEAERNRLLAGAGAMGGASLLSAQLGDEQRQRTEEAISTEIMRADEALKQQQQEEIRALEAAQGQQRAEAQAAAGAILGAGIEAGVTSAAQQQLFAGARAPSENTVQALATTLGVSPDVARGYIELSVTNPEVFKYLSVIGGRD